jgi:hypothetical protein
MQYAIYSIDSILYASSVLMNYIAIDTATWKMKIDAPDIAQYTDSNGAL